MVAIPMKDFLKRRIFGRTQELEKKKNFSTIVNIQTICYSFKKKNGQSFNKKHFLNKIVKNIFVFMWIF